MTTAPFDYLLIGHMTADLTTEGRRLGGTVSYAARTVKSFGLKTGLLTSAALNEPFCQDLQTYIDSAIYLPGESTSTFENIYTPSGRIQYIRGVAAPIGVSDIPDEWFGAPLVHLAPLTDEVSYDIPRHFPNATVMLTLQGWLRRWDADGRVRFKRWHDPEVLKHIDVVVFSEEDIAEAPELESEFAQTVRHLVVTRAEKGGTYYREGKPISYTTPQVEMVHPTGAGDVFAASLLAALPIMNHDMEKALQVAAHMGAISVTRHFLDGAPTPEEVQETLSALQPW